MLFCAAHVTASIDGEYFQILARSQDTAANLEIPYLIIQRQLEDPDGGVFYVESHDERPRSTSDYCRLSTTPSSRTCFLLLATLSVTVPDLTAGNVAMLMSRLLMVFEETKLTVLSSLASQ